MPSAWNIAFADNGYDLDLIALELQPIAIRWVVLLKNRKFRWSTVTYANHCHVINFPRPFKMCSTGCVVEWSEQEVISVPVHFPLGKWLLSPFADIRTHKKTSFASFRFFAFTPVPPTIYSYQCLRLSLSSNLSFKAAFGFQRTWQSSRKNKWAEGERLREREGMGTK